MYSNSVNQKDINILPWLFRSLVAYPNHNDPINPILKFCFLAQFVMNPLFFEFNIVITTYVPVNHENPVILSDKNEKSPVVTCFFDSLKIHKNFYGISTMNGINIYHRIELIVLSSFINPVKFHTHTKRY